MAESARAFVQRHTSLRPVDGLAGVRIHTADAILPLWRACQLATDDPDAALPYWAFAWAGGLTIARYLRDHPEVVAGRRVFDLAAGSGLCGLVALQSGAAEVVAADIDPFAVAAVRLNAKADGRRVSVVHRDVLDEGPPDTDVILAGDCWYETGFAQGVLPWLQRAQANGIDVLAGDPGRRYFPHEVMVELATYDVTTTTELEDMGQKTARVYAIRAGGA